MFVKITVNRFAHPHTAWFFYPAGFNLDQITHHGFPPRKDVSAQFSARARLGSNFYHFGQQLYPGNAVYRQTEPRGHGTYGWGVYQM